MDFKKAGILFVSLLLVMINISDAAGFGLKTIVDFSLEKLSMSKRTDNSIIDLTKLKTINRRGNFSIQGSLEFLVETGNNVQLSADVFQYQGNEFRKTPFKRKETGFCDYIKSDLLMPQVLNQTEVPPNTCPVPKGVYKINWYPDFSHVPPSFEGRFKVTINFKSNGKMSDEVTVIGEIHRYPAK